MQRSSASFLYKFLERVSLAYDISVNNYMTQARNKVSDNMWSRCLLPFPGKWRSFHGLHWRSSATQTHRASRGLIVPSPHREPLNYAAWNSSPHSLTVSPSRYLQCTRSTRSVLINQSHTTQHIWSGNRRSDHTTPALHQLHWLPVCQHVDFKTATLVHRSLSGISPSYLADDCRLVADARERRLRSTASQHARWHGHTAPLETKHS